LTKILVQKTPEDVIGKTDFDLFPYEFAQKRFAEEQQLMESGVPIINQEEVYVNNNTGEKLWNLSTKVPVKDKSGEVIGLIGINRDITERKLFEEKLIADKNLLNTIIENIPDPIYYKDRESRFVIGNTAIAQALGLKSPNEIIGKTDFDFHDEKSARKYFDTEKEIMKSGVSIINMENVFINRKTGEVTWELVTKAPIKDSSGKTIGLVGINRNITERKRTERTLRENEQKLSTLFSSMTEMVAIHEMVFDEHGEAVNYRITECNNAFSKITGIKEGDAVGKLATEVYQTKTPPYLNEYSQVAISGEPFDYTTYFAPMDRHFMVSVVSPRKNCFATITTDITDLKQTQEEMTAKKNELENYLYIASHDLRSPMVNIQGFSQRLQKQSDAIRAIIANTTFESETKEGLEKIINESIPKTLNFILSNVTKMDTLISGLLQISRTGRIKMNIQKIEMNRLLKTIITGFNFQLSEISAKVTIEELPDCYGDENQLNQLFSNIIGNAIKYKDTNRKLVIEIGGRTQYNKVIYFVKDTGIGIAPRYLGKVWDVFFRIDYSSNETGEGIGLSLAKRIVDKNKGKIWVESEEGIGSTFFIELQKKEFSE
jgi:PAS domain S-box-containing protein